MTSPATWLDPGLDFPDRMASLYAKDGLMAKKIKGFHPREGQKAFAVEVSKLIGEKSTLIAEAGTGTGKTFAYLVPAIAAGCKTIVSTAGKSLQDQLSTKDLPAIRSLLGIGVKTSVLKGRANYICHYRLELANSESFLPEQDSGAKLRMISRFAAVSETGDKGELSAVPEDDPLWPMVTSTRENCLGRDRCPHWDECFVRKARERALESDVIVVNHHLYLSSLALRNQSNNMIDGLLPDAALTVIDEAHQLPGIASDFFGRGFSTRELEKMADEGAVLSARATVGDQQNWMALRSSMQQALRMLIKAVNESGLAEGEKLAFDKIEKPETLIEPFDALSEVCYRYAEVFKANAGRDDELDTLSEWFAGLQFEVNSWRAIVRGEPLDVPGLEPAVPGTDTEDEGETPAAAQEGPRAASSAASRRASSVLWIEAGKQYARFNNTPLNFSADFRKMREEMGGAWVFTSATLSNSGNFTHFKSELGIGEAVERSWESPFNYWEQGCLYIPKIPAPANNTAVHTENVIDAVWPLIVAARGRTFVLCTSLAAVDIAAQRLEERLSANGLDYKLLVQGSAPKGALVRAFREHGHAVLVGSMGFWEGVDVQGDALSLVVIDKLPFSPPDDPVTEARCRQIREAGGHPFAAYTLPEAIIALKQGVGRLIRSETDRGMVVLCDTRVVDKPYGSIVLKNLPDFYRTRREEKALQFFLAPEKFKEGLYRQ